MEKMFRERLDEMSHEKKLIKEEHSKLISSLK